MSNIQNNIPKNLKLDLNNNKSATTVSPVSKINTYNQKQEETIDFDITNVSKEEKSPVSSLQTYWEDEIASVFDNMSHQLKCKLGISALILPSEDYQINWEIDFYDFIKKEAKREIPIEQRDILLKEAMLIVLRSQEIEVNENEILDIWYHQTFDGSEILTVTLENGNEINLQCWWGFIENTNVPLRHGGFRIDSITTKDDRRISFDDIKAEVFPNSNSDHHLYSGIEIESDKIIFYSETGESTTYNI